MDFSRKLIRLPLLQHFCLICESMFAAAVNIRLSLAKCPSLWLWHCFFGQIQYRWNYRCDGEREKKTTNTVARSWVLNQVVRYGLMCYWEKINEQSWIKQKSDVRFEFSHALCTFITFFSSLNCWYVFLFQCCFFVDCFITNIHSNFIFELVLLLSDNLYAIVHLQ